MDVIKPKLRFSIDSLVGPNPASPPAQREEPPGSPNEDSPHPLSAISLAPFLPRSLLSLHDRIPNIQRPQPINRSNDAPLYQGLGSKLPGFPNTLSQQLGISQLSQLQSVAPHINPLMVAGGVPGLTPSMPREYPLYPWLLSRHSRVFPQGLPGEVTHYRIF